MINALIVDDELSAIESLKWELSNFCSKVKIIDTFTNPTEAISAINYLKPNVVFLDIEMPELDGFQLLKKLSYRNFDLIITTAYNQYAIQAFKENAIDYLLKPVDPDELVKAMDKIKKNKTDNQFGGNIEKIFEKIISEKTGNKSKRVPLALSDRVVMVDKNDIMYCKSEGNYTHVIMKNGKDYLLSKSIKSVVELIPQAEFIRVHKSFIVNTNYITEYLRGDGGEIILTNKDNIPVSRTHKAKLLETLQIN
jgi:two-component system LytT family response regulator